MQVVMSEKFGMLAQFLPIRNEETAGVTEPAENLSSTSFRVLIVEGSVSLARLLATGLKAESLNVDVTHELDVALSKLDKAKYDLLILDMDLQNLDSVALLENLRSRYPDVRILALSAKPGIDGLVAALDHGADDFLPKPFSLLEMMARVRALRRRSNVSAPVVSKDTKVVLHRDQCRVERDGRLIDLTPREFTLLEYLMQNSGKTLSRALLTQEVWNMPAEGNTNIVDVYIKYLRDKLDGDHDIKMIRTVRGMGYLFQAQA